MSSELLIQVAKFTLLIVITSIIISFLAPARPVTCYSDVTQVRPYFGDQCPVWAGDHWWPGGEDGTLSGHQGPGVLTRPLSSGQRSTERGSQRGVELLLCLTQSVTYPGIRALRDTHRRRQRQGRVTCQHSPVCPLSWRHRRYVQCWQYSCCPRKSAVLPSQGRALLVNIHGV